MRWGDELTLGTVKLMAIFLARKKIEGFEIGGERPLLEFLELLNGVAAREAELGLWNDVMEEYLRRNYL